MLKNLSSLLLKIKEKLEHFRKSAELLETNLDNTTDTQTENYLRKKVTSADPKKEGYKYTYIGEFVEEMREGIGMMNFGNGD